MHLVCILESCFVIRLFVAIFCQTRVSLKGPFQNKKKFPFILFWFYSSTSKTNFWIDRKRIFFTVNEITRVEIGIF